MIDRPGALPDPDPHLVDLDDDDVLGWRRLDQRMLVLLPLQELVRNALWIGALVLLGSRRGAIEWYVGAGILFGVGLGAARWYTTSYRVSDQQVQLRRGILRRQVLSVPRDRLRSVDLTASLLHRMLGLASVRIGTGRSDRRDQRQLRLDGLRYQDAARLRGELLQRQPLAPGNVSQREPPRGLELARWHGSWVAYGPFTLSGAVALVAAVGFLAQLAGRDPGALGRVLRSHRLLGLASASPPVTVLVLAAAILLLVAAVSTLGYLFTFWNFRLDREAGTLQVRRGLLTHRVVALDERRLRGVELSEPRLLRLAGGARCIAIATGLRVGRGADLGGSMLLPPAPRELAQRVAGAVARSPQGVVCPLRRHGPIAHRRRYTRVLGLALPALLALAVAWWAGATPGWPAWLALAVLLVGLALAQDRWRNLGHAVADGHLVTAYGSLVRRRCLLASEGIVGWNLHQSFFQRRAGVVTLIATTAAGRQAYPVQDLLPEVAAQLAEEVRPGLLAPFLAPGHPAAP